MKRLPFALSFSVVALLCMMLISCGGSTNTVSTNPTATPAPPVTLNVFAAASLTKSFTAISQQYHTLHPNVTLKFNFAGSQLLEQQLVNGAPADVFASADIANMTKATTAGLVTTSHIFARNKLVVIVSTKATSIATLNDLTRPGTKIDIEASTVPAGAYTLQALAKLSLSPTYGAGYKAAVLKNVVSQEDNVEAVVQKVELGEADAGFVYLTDTTNITPAYASQVKMITIPDEFNVIAQYPIAVVKQSANAVEAQNFVQYVLSADGQAILTKYHFVGV